MTGPGLFDPEWITADEVQWLRMLAAGVTVQQIAEKAGYSERLSTGCCTVCTEGCGCRTAEAILQASRWGLLDK